MKMKSVIPMFAPLIIFGVVVFFLWMGLHHNPRLLPSPLINKTIPQFSAENLQHPAQMINEKDFKGKVSIVNVFATWCIACHTEHPVWMEIKKTMPPRSPAKIQIVGLNYKDNRKTAQQWLAEYGDPYDQILFDPHGEIGINFGVYGTPETFIVDKQGIIRFKQIGAISPRVWKEKLLPEIQKWQNE